jgi:Uma2 family endonuclease
MSNLAHTHSKILPEDYLAREMASPTRSEFVDGSVYAMSGASDRHGLVTLALGSRLFDRVPANCQVFTSDMKLRIADEATSIVYYYPDVLVSCAADDREKYYRDKPVLLIEVISPSTERIDRIEKLAAYKRIPSLVEYVIAEQDMPKVEVFRRRTAWHGEEYLTGTTFHLESVGMEFSIDDVYRRVGP